MLLEVSSDVFRSGPVSFHHGLNVVLGDEKATNSIGKSSLLMILDFIYGGETYLSHNQDTINELGHHEFKFKMQVGEVVKAFRRSTNSPESIRGCDLEYNPIQIIPLAEYTEFLKTVYMLDEIDSSFRSVISLYSRIWGKDNAFVAKPLHSFASQKAMEAIDNLVKLFNKYSQLKPLIADLHDSTNQKEYLKSAQKGSYAPKITKTKYDSNFEKRGKINGEIENIKSELSKYAANIREIVNRDVLELKIKKDSLLEKKLEIESKLLRVSANLNSSRHIKSKSFKQLKEFFPDINSERLEKVELFHSRISQILKKELESSRSIYSGELSAVNDEIRIIDDKMRASVTSIENPGTIIDRTFGLLTEMGQIDRENKTYDQSIQISARVDISKSTLADRRKSILTEIEFELNDEMRNIAQQVYVDANKSPIVLFTDSNYQFEVYEDTGTGKAFSSLLIFDLAVFKLTKLPLLIHDSFLFKNIQNTAVSGLVDRYVASEKQSFIAIDEISKYGPETSKRLEANAVIKLADDRTLFVKDWRK